MRRFASALAACAALLLAASCAGGKEAEPDRRAELAKAIASADVDDLALMPLPREELGEDAAGLEVDIGESGPSDNEDAAENTLDPEDSGEELGRNGRIAGYDLLYVDPSAYATGDGLVSVGTSIDLFNSAESASGLLQKERADHERLRGTATPAGTLSRVETSTLDGLGEEAFDLQVTYDSGGAATYGTAVGFRVGRIVGWVVVGKPDGADERRRVEELARALEQRIEGVLLGDVTGKPVAVPGAEPEPPLDEGLDLAAMALGLDDLPAGFSVIREEYVRDGVYQRELDPGTARIGRSRLSFLENDLELFDGAFEAGSALNGISAFFSSGSAELLEVVEGQFAESTGIEPSGVTFEQVPTPGLADGSLAIRMTVETRDGTFEGYYVFFQVERVLAVLFVVAKQGQTSFDDLRPLAEAVIEHITAGFPAA